MKHFILGVSAFFLVACGSSSSTGDEGGIEIYTISATPSAGAPSFCRSAHGDIVINDSAVSGTLKRDSSDIIYVVSGTYIRETNEIEGGFAVSKTTVAEFSGTINGSTGSGRWSDDYGCDGTWTAIKK